MLTRLQYKAKLFETLEDAESQKVNLEKQNNNITCYVVSTDNMYRTGRGFCIAIYDAGTAYDGFVGWFVGWFVD